MENFFFSLSLILKRKFTGQIDAPTATLTMDDTFCVSAFVSTNGIVDWLGQSETNVFIQNGKMCKSTETYDSSSRLGGRRPLK